jgi:hippurate hydrolase
MFAERTATIGNRHVRGANSDYEESSMSASIVVRTTIWVLTLVAVGATSRATFGQNTEPQAWAKENIAELGELYRHFHAHPELSFHEKDTSARLAKEWAAIGAEVTTDVGGHGVVGILKNGDGPTLMLRCDMDALPVVEQTGLVYASTVRVKGEQGVDVGVMHACGHDIHMTNLVGVARYLATHKDRWRGRVLLVAQPAEEKGAGAKAMLEDGLFERFGKPDFAVALHVDAGRAAGQIGYSAGPSLANVDSVDVTMRGKGGHGAYPHMTIDPIVQAAQFVMSLQTIVSREVKPIDAAVVTVGSIHGGTKHNIIGDDCHMQLTVRSYSDPVRRQLLESIRRKAHAVAAGAGAPEPIIALSEGTPALENDSQMVERLAPVFRRVLGEANVALAEPSMGGEDFSRYGRAGVPILMFWLGSVDGPRLARYIQLGQPPPTLHSPLFYPDYEKTLITGVSAMSGAALALLAP